MSVPRAASGGARAQVTTARPRRALKSRSTRRHEHREGTGVPALQRTSRNDATSATADAAMVPTTRLAAGAARSEADG